MEICPPNFIIHVFVYPWVILVMLARESFLCRFAQYVKSSKQGEMGLVQKETP